MNKDILEFIIAFICPLVWHRTLFVILPIAFKRPFTRNVLKIRWHHLHWGILMILAGTISLIIFGKSFWIIALLGVGLGNIMDLFIPSVLVETDRVKELILYRNSLVWTIFLFIFIILSILAVSLWKSGIL